MATQEKRLKFFGIITFCYYGQTAMRVCWARHSIFILYPYFTRGVRLFKKAPQFK
jgi:hypothetical protein